MNDDSEATETVCFGKPMCLSCYDETCCDLAIDPPSDADLVCPEAFSSWLSCDCGKSIFCQDCYSETKLQNVVLCQLCDGTRRKIHSEVLSDSRSDDSDATDGDSLDSPLWTEKELHHEKLKTINWALQEFLPPLNITPSSKLGQFVIGVLESGNVPPGEFFDGLNILLADGSLESQSLNEEKEIIEEDTLTNSMKKYKTSTRTKMGISASNTLDSLMVHLASFIPQARVAEYLVEAFTEDQLQMLNKKSMSERIRKHISDLEECHLQVDMVAGITLDVDYPSLFVFLMKGPFGRVFRTCYCCGGRRSRSRDIEGYDIGS